MASRRKGGGIGGFLISVVVIIAAAAVIFSFMKINNIQSAGDVYDFFKSKSDKTSECADGTWWKCNPVKPDDESGSNGSGDDSSGDSADSGSSEAKPASDYISKLDGVPTVEATKASYSRSDWKHWTGSPCNTREEIVKSSGKNVKVDDSCKAISGEWTDPYTGKKYTDSSKMDLDHGIALNYANSHGAAGWSADKKTKFANDKSQLILSGASPNRAKGDKGPSEWMPENESYRCEYAKIWVDTAVKYSDGDFGLAKADKKALKSTLESCG